PLHLLGLLVAAAVFHGALAQSRPAPSHLTLFYWWIAVGGLLGGVWNAIAAPVLFPTVLEYPLALLLGLWLLQAPDFASARWGKLRLRLTLPLGLGLLGGGLLVGISGQWSGHTLAGLVGAIALVGLAGYAAGFGRWKLTIGLALVVLLNQFSVGAQAGVLASDRSFFGVYRVLQTTAHGGYHSLLHGTTLHGKQSLAPSRQNEPLTYFTRTGPIGQLFDSMQQRSTPLHTVGVLGLGVGTLAAYGQPGQAWTFYEIDPLAQQLATNPAYFRFLQDSPAQVEIALGDGRLAIARTPNQSFDLLVMDAFSSDSIPLHLITQEAIRLYFAKLAPNGLLAINITNRFLDLNPVLGAIAQSLNLVSLTQSDLEVSDLERNQGKAPSRWVVLARQRQALGSLLNDPRWQAIAPTTAPVWTDDFSNILHALRQPGR
ncbi:MAG TPA: fused MFS/spermidine synthase, partial [Chroococcidiopsis sp.]